MNPDASFWCNRPVLITGHTGFKGSWLTFWLSKLGADVSGYALDPATRPNLFDEATKGRAADHRGDIRDFEKVAACMRATAPKVLFHLAAQPFVRHSYGNPIETFATNVMGTVNVLEAARGTPSLEAIIVVTSDKCYENREWVWPYRETDPLGGYDPYSCSKGCAELVSSSYRSSFFSGAAGHKARLASARAGNVIGGGDWSADRLVPDTVRAFEAGQKVTIRNPDSTRPWQHVLDPLLGYLLLAERLSSDVGDSFAEAWNFGPPPGDCGTVASVVDQMASVWGDGAGWMRSEGMSSHEAQNLMVDASKARARLSWYPRLVLTDAIAWTVEWYKAHREGASMADLILDQVSRYEMRLSR